MMASSAEDLFGCPFCEQFVSQDRNEVTLHVSEQHQEDDLMDLETIQKEREGSFEETDASRLWGDAVKVLGKHVGKKCIVCCKEVASPGYKDHTYHCHRGYGGFRCQLCPSVAYTYSGTIIKHYRLFHGVYSVELEPLLCSQAELSKVRLAHGKEQPHDQPAKANGPSNASFWGKSVKALGSNGRFVGKKCLVCAKEVPSPEYRNHVYVCHRGVGFKCRECPLVGYLHSRSITRHYRTFHGVKNVNLEMVLCSKTELSQMKEAQKKAISTSKWHERVSVGGLWKQRCRVCQKVIPVTEVKHHGYMCHLGYSGYKCDKCQNVYAHLQTLKKHYIQDHHAFLTDISHLLCTESELIHARQRQLATQGQVKSSSSSRVLGEDAGHNRKNLASEASSNMAEIDGSKFECEHCPGCFFEDCESLEAHYRDEHKENKPTGENTMLPQSKSEKLLKESNWQELDGLRSANLNRLKHCKLCKTTVLRREMIHHENMCHNGYGGYKCATCPDVAYKFHLLMQKHYRSVHGTRCPDTSQLLCSKAELEEREELRLKNLVGDQWGEKVGEGGNAGRMCKICNKMCLITPCKLIHHTNMCHRGFSGYRCDQCQAVYSHDDAMKKHYKCAHGTLLKDPQPLLYR